MANCKYPKCNKILIGKEKVICTSCKDKIKSGAGAVLKVTGATVLGLLTVVSIGKNFKDKS